MNISEAFKHVLIVDDDPIFREVLKAFFQSHGVEKISFAEDGNKGRDFITAYHDTIDLISCDLNMPDADGIEFMQHLQTLKSTIPVMIVSSAHKTVMASAEILAKTYGIKLVGVLKKPVNPQDVEATITKYLSA